MLLYALPVVGMDDFDPEKRILLVLLRSIARGGETTITMFGRNRLTILQADLVAVSDDRGQQTVIALLRFIQRVFTLLLSQVRDSAGKTQASIHLALFVSVGCHVNAERLSPPVENTRRRAALQCSSMGGSQQLRLALCLEAILKPRTGCEIRKSVFWSGQHRARCTADAQFMVREPSDDTRVIGRNPTQQIVACRCRVSGHARHPWLVALRRTRGVKLTVPLPPFQGRSANLGWCPHGDDSG